MIEQLIACPCCGGLPKIGRSQRIKMPVQERRFDYRIFGEFGCDGPPKLGDYGPRPPEVPTTVQLRCVYCADCELSTKWEEVGDNETEFDAMDRAGKKWNIRVGRPVYSNDDVRTLARKELGAPDVQLLLAMAAATTDEADWSVRGPIFQAAAERVVEATLAGRDFWPIDPTLHDADRYRKLVQLVKMVTVDGVPSVQFPCIPSKIEYIDHAWEDKISMTVDDLPDRDRW